jgi:hypothetical protein
MRLLFIFFGFSVEMTVGDTVAAIGIGIKAAIMAAVRLF